MLPRVLSAISGCVWAGIAWVLLDQRINAGIAGGILASPLIGIVMGSFSKDFRERPILVRTAVALITLYIAAALFGTAGGVADFAFGSGMRTAGAIVGAVWAFVWGLTFSGYFVLLWPLSYLNHSVIARTWSDADREQMVLNKSGSE